jgi:hypothetical protein
MIRSQRPKESEPGCSLGSSLESKAVIWLCAALLARAGLSIWIPIAVAVIVGLHFIPLARVFEVPLYYWTGVLSVLGMVGCSLIGDAGMRLLCAGLTMAAVLWMSALLLLLRA